MNIKKSLFSIFLILFLFNLVFSQNELPEVEQIRKIKIFESTQNDFKKIFAKFIDEDFDEEDSKQWFFTKNGRIEVTFSSGNCDDDSEYWNISKGIVTYIAFASNDGIKLRDVGLNLSKFKKEAINKDFPEDYDLHNEKEGILIKVEDDEIRNIIFYPPKSKNAFLCSNGNTSEILTGEERIVDNVFPLVIICPNYPPIINQINLSDIEVFSSKNKTEVLVSVVATDPENDVLTYSYKVSNGKIIGEGASVIWDLTNVEKGTHTITVTIDDGCGDCAAPMTKTVFVK